MAGKQVVVVKGLPEFARGSAELTHNIGEASAVRLGRLAEQVAGETRMRVPYLTGRLAGSVKWRLAKSQRRATVRMGGGVPYAGWIEFGGTRGRPYVKQGRYLYPTAIAAEPRAVAACDDAAKDEIRSMRWPRP